VLNKNPETEEVFAQFGMHCLGCPTATGESLEQAAMVHGIDLDEMIVALNKKASK
jgi:hybrid cluster-associated redox disulfide protein